MSCHKCGKDSCSSSRQNPGCRTSASGRRGATGGTGATGATGGTGATGTTGTTGATGSGGLPLTVLKFTGSVTTPAVAGFRSIGLADSTNDTIAGISTPSSLFPNYPLSAALRVKDLAVNLKQAIPAGWNASVTLYRNNAPVVGYETLLPGGTPAGVQPITVTAIEAFAANDLLDVVLFLNSDGSGADTTIAVSASISVVP